MSEEQIKAVAQAYREMQEAMHNKKEKEKEKDDNGTVKLDPVGQADDDVDNDGDVDNSDKYIKTKRAAIKKAMDKEKDGVDEKLSSKEKMKRGMYNEADDLDSDNVEKALKHDCATHVEHAEYGIGKCIPGQHTLMAINETHGYVTHYDVEFNHGIVEDVAVEDLTIIQEMSHGHKSKKKKPMEGMSSKEKMKKGLYNSKQWGQGTIIDEDDGKIAVLFNHGVEWIAEDAHAIKNKNTQDKMKDQEMLDPRAKGEQDFKDAHEVEETDEMETVGVDTKGMTSGVKKAPSRPGDKAGSEPMKSTPKVTGQ